jgi:hypothetical protein
MGPSISACISVISASFNIIFTPILIDQDLP